MILRGSLELEERFHLELILVRESLRLQLSIVRHSS